jgi:hypothetical protein
MKLIRTIRLDPSDTFVFLRTTVTGPEKTEPGRVALHSELAAPSWLDQNSGGPRT